MYNPKRANIFWIIHIIFSFKRLFICSLFAIKERNKYKNANTYPPQTHTHACSYAHQRMIGVWVWRWFITVGAVYDDSQTIIWTFHLQYIRTERGIELFLYPEDRNTQSSRSYSSIHAESLWLSINYTCDY